MPKATANTLTEFPFKSMGTIESTAPPTITDFARIITCLKPVTGDLNKLCKELGMVLVPMWRCSHRNSRWRCSGVTHAPRTKCLRCRESKNKRERAYWVLKIISNSIKKDNRLMCEGKFVRCQSCKTPMLRIPHKRGRKPLQMCPPCRKLRLQKQYRKSKEKLHCPYKQIVMCSGGNDKNQKRLPRKYDFRNDPRYLTVDFLKNLRRKQKNKCYFCGVAMVSNTNRLENSNALQIDRLTHGPHWADDCVFACSACNSRSWRPGWGPFPHHLSLKLGYKFDPDKTHQGYLLGHVENRIYKRLENEQRFKKQN